MLPVVAWGTMAPLGRSCRKAATSIDTSPRALHWHMRNSSLPLSALRPGASGQASSISPLSRRALQVPQVPLAHS